MASSLLLLSSPMQTGSAKVPCMAEISADRKP